MEGESFEATPNTGEQSGVASTGVEASADLSMIQAQLARSEQEVSNLRAITENLTSVAGGTETPASVEDALDAFEKDPSAYIADGVKDALEATAGKELAEVQQALGEMRAEKAQAELGTLVEGFEGVLSGEGFKGFIRENPIYGQVLAAANQSFDVKAVAGVIKHFQGLDKVPEIKGEKNPLNPSSKAGSGSGRVFSREAIKELSAKNPVAYAKISDQIALAYKEGRVK